MDKENHEVHILMEELHTIYFLCVETPSYILIYILQTISALIRGVFKKSHGDIGFDVIDILVGFDSAESQMQV